MEERESPAILFRIYEGRNIYSLQVFFFISFQVALQIVLTIQLFLYSYEKVREVSFVYLPAHHLIRVWRVPERLPDKKAWKRLWCFSSFESLISREKTSIVSATEFFNFSLFSFFVFLLLRSLA